MVQPHFLPLSFTPEAGLALSMAPETSVVPAVRVQAFPATPAGLCPLYLCFPGILFRPGMEWALGECLLKSNFIPCALETLLQMGFDLAVKQFICYQTQCSCGQVNIFPLAKSLSGGIAGV